MLLRTAALSNVQCSGIHRESRVLLISAHHTFSHPNLGLKAHVNRRLPALPTPNFLLQRLPSSLFLTHPLTPWKCRTRSARTRVRTSSRAALVGVAALTMVSCIGHVSAQASPAPAANNSRSCVQVVDVVDDFSLGGQSNCRACGQLSFSFSLEGTTAVEINTVSSNTELTVASDSEL